MSNSDQSDDFVENDIFAILNCSSEGLIAVSDSLIVSDEAIYWDQFAVFEIMQTTLEPFEGKNAVAVAGALVRQSLSIYGWSSKRGWRVSYAVSAMPQILDDVFASFTSTQQKKWDNDVKENLIHIVTSKPVRIAAKTYLLAFDHECVFKSARIITDVRPVFNEDANDIDAMLVSYTLRLDLLKGSGAEESLSVVMDAEEIALLLSQCSRAMQKGAVAKRLMSSRMSVPVRVLSENTADTAAGEDGEIH